MGGSGEGFVILGRLGKESRCVGWLVRRCGSWETGMLRGLRGPSAAFLGRLECGWAEKQLKELLAPMRKKH